MFSLHRAQGHIRQLPLRFFRFSARRKWRWLTSTLGRLDQKSRGGHIQLAHALMCRDSDAFVSRRTHQ